MIVMAVQSRGTRIYQVLVHEPGSWSGWYEINRAASKRRANKLQSYLTKHVWDPSTRRSWADFICASKTDCKASALKSDASFHEAQGHAVGRCFDLRRLTVFPFACSSCRWKPVPGELASPRASSVRDGHDDW